MKKMITCFLIACAASMIAFVIHVVTVAWIANFVSLTMEGLEVKPSWDVRYIAAFTSMEIGISLVVIYTLVRKSTPVKSSITKGFILGILLLMIQGSLIRQPLMDFIISNPLKVVLIQDGVNWLIWLVISILVAITYEYFVVGKNQFS